MTKKIVVINNCNKCPYSFFYLYLFCELLKRKLECDDSICEIPDNCPLNNLDDVLDNCEILDFSNSNKGEYYDR